MALPPSTSGRRNHYAAPKPTSFSPYPGPNETPLDAASKRTRQSTAASRSTNLHPFSRVSPPHDAQSTSSSTLVNQEGSELASVAASGVQAGSARYPSSASLMGPSLRRPGVPFDDDDGLGVEWIDQAGPSGSSSSNEDTLKRLLRHQRRQEGEMQISPRQDRRRRGRALSPSASLANFPSMAPETFDISPPSSPRPELRLGCPEGCQCTEEEIELGLCRCASSVTTTASSSEDSSSLPSSVALGKRKDLGGSAQRSRTAFSQRPPAHRRQQSSDASIRTMTPGGVSSVGAASTTSSPRKSEASTVRGSAGTGRRDLDADPVLVPRWAVPQAQESSDDASTSAALTTAGRSRALAERRLASSPGPRPRPSPRSSWSRPRTASPDHLEPSAATPLVPSLYAQGRRQEARRSAADLASGVTWTPLSAPRTGGDVSISSPSTTAPRSATRRSIENVFERVRKQMERDREAVEEQRRAREGRKASTSSPAADRASRVGDSLGEDTLLQLKAEREHDERRLERIRSRASGASSASSGSAGQGRGSLAALEASTSDGPARGSDIEDAARGSESGAHSVHQHPVLEPPPSLARSDGSQGVPRHSAPTSADWTIRSDQVDSEDDKPIGFDSLDLPPLPSASHAKKSSSSASRPPHFSWTASTPRASPAKAQPLSSSSHQGTSSLSHLTIPASPAPASTAPASQTSPMSWTFPGTSPLQSPSLSSPGGGSSSPRRGVHRRGGPGAAGAEALVATRIGQSADGSLSPVPPSPSSPQVLSISRRFPPGDAERAMRALQDALGPSSQGGQPPSLPAVEPREAKQGALLGGGENSLSVASASAASRSSLRARQVRFSPQPDYRSASSQEEDEGPEEEEADAPVDAGDGPQETSFIAHDEEADEAGASADHAGAAEEAEEAEETQDSLAELGSQSHTGFAPYISPIKPRTARPLARQGLDSPATPRPPGGFASPGRIRTWGLAPSATISSTPLHLGAASTPGSKPAAPSPYAESRQADGKGRVRTTSPPPLGLKIPQLPALTRSAELLRNQRGSPKPPGSFGTPVRMAGATRGQAGLRSASSTPSLIRWSEMADASNTSGALDSVAEDEAWEAGEANEHAGDASTVQSTPDISITSSGGVEEDLPKQSTPPRKARTSSSFLSGTSANGSFVDERGREVPAIGEGIQEESEGEDKADEDDAGPNSPAQGSGAEDDSILVTLRQLRRISQAPDAPRIQHPVSKEEASGTLTAKPDPHDPPAASAISHKERARSFVPLIKQTRSRISRAASNLGLPPTTVAAQAAPRWSPVAVAAAVTIQLSMAWLLFCSAQARLDDLYADTILDPFFPALYAPDFSDGSWGSWTLMGAGDFGHSTPSLRRLALWIYDLAFAPSPPRLQSWDKLPSAWEPWMLLLSALLRPLHPIFARLPLNAGALLLGGATPSSSRGQSFALLAFDLGQRAAT